jgi:integrase
MPRDLITSDAALRNIKPGDPRRRISDGGGLYLLLFVKGGAHGWRLDYTFGGRRKTISLGTYPDTTLSIARKKAREARERVAAGLDPSELRKQERSAVDARQQERVRADAGLPPLNSFEAVAREWLEVRNDGWAPGYSSKVTRRLEVDVFPYLGRRDLRSITPPEFLAVLRRIEERGVIETAHRALESCSQIMRYGVITGRADSDPCRDLKGALKKAPVTHLPAVTQPQRLGQLLRAMHAYQGTPIVRAALRLMPLVLLRPGELRHARWDELDLENATWLVPSQRMKRTVAGKRNGDPHLVPLPPQAVAAFADLRPLTGDSPGGYVFRGERHHDRPMSENTINAALRAMGFGADEVTGHGFRATARTLLEERLGVAPAVIEAQLAHTVADRLGRAYNRTEFADQRRAMLQRWADYLEDLRISGAVS